MEIDSDYHSQYHCIIVSLYLPPLTSPIQTLTLHHLAPGSGMPMMEIDSEYHKEPKDFVRQRQGVLDVPQVGRRRRRCCMRDSCISHISSHLSSFLTISHRFHLPSFYHAHMTSDCLSLPDSFAVSLYRSSYLTSPPCAPLCVFRSA